MNETQEWRLYMGANIPGGGVVTDEDFERFVRFEVDTRLDGYTLYADARGAWKGEQERVRILLSIGGDGLKVQAVARAYAKAFGQECVMLTVSDIRAAFVTAAG